MVKTSTLCYDFNFGNGNLLSQPDIGSHFLVRPRGWKDSHRPERLIHQLTVDPHRIVGPLEGLGPPTAYGLGFVLPEQFHVEIVKDGGWERWIDIKMLQQWMPD